MNEEFTTDPERALQTTSVVYRGEGSRAAASSKHAAQSTRISGERETCFSMLTAVRPRH